MDASTRWYGLAIGILILGWLGSYINRVSVPVQSLPGQVRYHGRSRWQGALLFSGLTLAAIGLNLWSVLTLKAAAYSSWAGGLGWLASLVLLGVAASRMRSDFPLEADVQGVDPDAQADLRLSRRVEMLILLAIVTLAFALRMYRLGDWTTGMHGDEGEVGMDALSIVHGNWVTPFGVGWYAQPNIYYWSVALSMMVFGTGLFGLRMFAVLAGTLTILPFYLLVRQWFGKRTAILSATFLSISDVAIHFSRQQFSNVTTPLLLVLGFYLFFRGLRSGRWLHFVLAGFANAFSLYFYLGGRLTPIVLAGSLLYLFVLLPLIRLPGHYFRGRRTLPRPGRLRALAASAGVEARAFRPYAGPLAMCALAMVCMATPWTSFYLDNRSVWDARAGEKLIFNNADRMASQHGVGHGPLYLGLKVPDLGEPIPLPLSFEQGRASVKVADDGFWVRVLWRQLTATLSILTYRFDCSSVYTFTMEPVAKPIEAVLIILGIAWALWRWRDTRMGLLSIWFWSTVFIGGTLTIDAPYMARLVGIMPALAVFAALPLSKLSCELITVFGGFGRSPRGARAARWGTSLGLLALMGFLTWQNFTDYYQRYISPWAFSESGGQAVFVRDMKRRAAEQGRPMPSFYHMAVHLIYWDYGVNRFLNYGTPGIDVVNASSILPIVDDGGGDAIFMVWEINKHYLAALKAYYPEGESSDFVYGAGHPRGGRYLFTSFRVTAEQIRARRVADATYVSAAGQIVARSEHGFGSTEALPAGLSFPVQASWDGQVFIPRSGAYRFRVDGSKPVSLAIDGELFVNPDTPGVHYQSVQLVRGLHSLKVSGELQYGSAKVQVSWATDAFRWSPIPEKYLWKGPGRGLLGEVHALSASPFAMPVEKPSALRRRVDGFLGFRGAPAGLEYGTSLEARWTGELDIASAGVYGFSTVSAGGSALWIDERLVVDNRHEATEPREASGQLALEAGPHRVEVAYVWRAGSGYLEVFWQPPGQNRTLLGPQGLHTSGGVAIAAPDTDAGLILDRTVDDAQPPASDESAAAEAEPRVSRALAVDTAGVVYAVDAEHQRVLLLSQDGRVTGSIGAEGSGQGQFGLPEDVAIGPDSNVYVLDSKLGRVQVFDSKGASLAPVGGGGWCSPAGFTVGPDGMIYVAETCASRVRKFDRSGQVKGEYFGGVDPATRLEQPVDVVVDSTGTIYVADLRDRIVALDPKSDTILRSWPVHVGRASGGANLVLSGSTLYLSDPDLSLVQSIVTSGSVVTSIGKTDQGSGPFNAPLGIAVGPKGELYVGDGQFGRIQVFQKLNAN